MCRKVLKSWLAAKDKRIPRTHNMADLLPLLSADVVEDMSEEILLLDRFYIPTRYPDALPGSLEEALPNEQEAQGALNLAKKVLESISKIL
jgi:HEPN domain-containing protein